MGQLKTTGAAFVGGAGVSPTHMAKEFAADQLFGCRTTVERDKGATACLVAMDGPRKQLFANTCFAVDEYGHAPTAELLRPVDGRP